MTVKRTTIELDQELLARAQRALGQRTVRATVEESLRRAAAGIEASDADRSDRQQAFLDSLDSCADLEVLRSDAMWR